MTQTRLGQRFSSRSNVEAVSFVVTRMSVGREAVEHLIVEAALSAGRTRKDVEAIIHK